MGVKEKISQTFNNSKEAIEKRIKENKENKDLKKAVESVFEKLMLLGDGKKNKEVYGQLIVPESKIYFPLTHDISINIGVKDFLRGKEGTFIKLIEKDSGNLHSVLIKHNDNEYEVPCVLFKYKVSDM